MPVRSTLIALLALMAITRIGHFGSFVSLPDASLAVFLLGGMWLAGWGAFAAFMALAFAIDVGLAQSATEAGWCLTPAYWGLLPTYALLWQVGRWLRAWPELPPVRFAAVSALAVTFAFVVSNATFWAFSGLFPEMSAAEYAQRVMGYYPPYLGSAALYLALGWLAHRLLTARRTALV
ncbi:MAG: hypothetical protein ACK4TK_10840 [Thiobacillaceae bacterium]